MSDVSDMAILSNKRFRNAILQPNQNNTRTLHAFLPILFQDTRTEFTKLCVGSAVRFEQRAFPKLSGADSPWWRAGAATGSVDGREYLRGFGVPEGKVTQPLEVPGEEVRRLIFEG